MPGFEFLTTIAHCLRRFVRAGSAIKITNALIVSLFLVNTAICPAQSPASAKELVKKGTLLMSRNKVDAAIESYSRAIELSPNYAEAYVNRGMARRAKGDLAGSIEDYEKARSINPKTIQGNRFVAQAYSNRGFIKLNDLDVDNAIQDFTIAIEINSNEPDHYYRRGLARLINEDLLRALDDLNKSLSISSSDPIAKAMIYSTQGMVKLLQGKEEDAEKDFEIATKLTEGTPFIVEHHLRSLEVQIVLMRQRRAKQQKIII
jgi:tetratricopeptide (TPR) repeat protein